MSVQISAPVHSIIFQGIFQSQPKHWTDPAVFFCNLESHTASMTNKNNLFEVEERSRSWLRQSIVDCRKEHRSFKPFEKQMLLFFLLATILNLNLNPLKTVMLFFVFINRHKSIKKKITNTATTTREMTDIPYCFSVLNILKSIYVLLYCYVKRANQTNQTKWPFKTLKCEFLFFLSITTSEISGHFPGKPMTVCRVTAKFVC